MQPITFCKSISRFGPLKIWKPPVFLIFAPRMQLERSTWNQRDSFLSTSRFYIHMEATETFKRNQRQKPCRPSISHIFFLLTSSIRIHVITQKQKVVLIRFTDCTASLSCIIMTLVRHFFYSSKCYTELCRMGMQVQGSIRNQM